VQAEGWTWGGMETELSWGAGNSRPRSATAVAARAATERTEVSCIVDVRVSVVVSLDKTCEEMRGDYISLGFPYVLVDSSESDFKQVYS
jgi:hypothetical protein